MNAPTVDTAELTRSHWSDAEQENVALIADFVQLVMNDHDYDEARARFGMHRYTQHSRAIPDGMGALIDYLEDLTKRFPEYSYDVKRITADGDHVTFHSHATMKQAHRGNDAKGFNIIDTWRLADGEVAEHWDAIQPLSLDMRLFALVTGGRTKHDNGLF